MLGAQFCQTPKEQFKPKFSQAEAGLSFSSPMS